VKTTAVSLQAPIQYGEQSEFQDLIPDDAAPLPDKTVGDAELRCRMLAMVALLDARERTILTLRFGLNGERPHTLEEVSHVIHRTRERIRQIQNTALAKLNVLLGEDSPGTARRIA
jgi:RNA polymerase primary sigma factor